jgi:hypothetical protein
MPWKIIFLIVAILLFILAGLNVAMFGWNLVAFGLAAFAASFLVRPGNV